MADLARLVGHETLVRKRTAFERGEPAAGGFARPRECILRRPGALQPVAGVAAQRRAEHAAEQARDRDAQALAFQVP